MDQNDPEGKAEWHRLYTVNYLITKAEAEHKTPAQIVGELVRKELKAAM